MRREKPGESGHPFGSDASWRDLPGTGTLRRVFLQPQRDGDEPRVLFASVSIAVAKWGNSLAIRIPKTVAREAGLTPGATVQMTAADDGVLITPAAPRYNLRDLVAGITPKNRHGETDWGGPVGRELW